jgi:hypothetical protein
VISSRSKLGDVAFLFTISVLLAVPYATRVGFYSDDWSLIANQVMADDQSWPGLFRAIDSPDKEARPFFYAAVVTLFYAVGVAPSAFQAANTAVLGSVAALLYLVSIRLGAPRALALAFPAVYILLPHYSATRFWVVAFALNLSLLWFLSSVYAALRAVDAQGTRVIWWHVIWAVSLVASVLTYETVLPLACALPFVLGHSGRSPVARSTWSLSLQWLMKTAVVLAPALIWKTTHSIRFHEISLTDRIEWFVEFLSAQASNSFVHFGARLPVLVIRASQERREAILIAGLIGLALFFYLRHIAKHPADAWPSGLRPTVGVMAAGLASWLLALSLFFVSLAPAAGAGGINNRLVNVAALGYAAVVIGLCGCAAWLTLGARSHRSMFPALVALHGAAGALVINVLAGYWVNAAEEQDRVVAAIRRDVALDDLTVLIVDGICPYVGPGIVFESSWDLRSRLAIDYGRWPKGADVVTSNMAPSADGLVVSMYYGFVKKLHPYTDLQVYDVRTSEITRLHDEASARTYFQQRQDPGCPPGGEGGGVPVLGLPP